MFITLCSANWLFFSLFTSDFFVCFCTECGLYQFKLVFMVHYACAVETLRIAHPHNFVVAGIICWYSSLNWIQYYLGSQENFFLHLCSKYRLKYDYSFKNRLWITKIKRCIDCLRTFKWVQNISKIKADGANTHRPKIQSL